jgi:hypothetical protein
MARLKSTSICAAGCSICWVFDTQHYQLCQLVLPTSDWRTIAAIAVAPSLVTEMADRSSRAWLAQLRACNQSTNAYHSVILAASHAIWVRVVFEVMRQPLSKPEYLCGKRPEYQ